MAKLSHTKVGRPFDIHFSSELENTIFNLVSIHNTQHPTKKVGIDVARKVVDRGITACVGNKQATASDRSEFGLARLRIFLLKKLGSGNKRYNIDNDLLNK